MSTQPKKRKYQAYPDDKECPCESGIPYGQCCKQKKFKFVFDERGNVRKQVRIHRRLQPVLEEAAAEFRKMLGRSPGPHDPVLFNHHLSGEEDYWQQVRNIGRAADIPEQLIFAYRRSGFIVGEHSRQMMSESEYEEWTDAIDEYYVIKEDGFDPFFVFSYLTGGGVRGL